MIDKQRLFRSYDWGRTLRRAGALHRHAERKWWVVRFAQARQVMTDFDAFSADLRPLHGQPTNGMPPTLTSCDPPRHHELRRLVSTAFAPRSIAVLEPRIEALVDELLDRCVTGRRMDVVSDFAAPLPGIVIAALVGVPRARADALIRWSHEAFAAATAARSPELTRRGDEMHRYLEDLIRERRERPGDDVVSALLSAQLDNGDRLGRHEVLELCALLLVAGNLTTTNLIANAMLCLDWHRDALDRVRDDPSLLPAAIEETLRYFSPIQRSPYRLTTRAVELDGQSIPQGHLVGACFGSANRDESAIPDPHRFDIDRPARPHLAFGHGVHFCLGAALARLEARVALGRLLERLPPTWRIEDTQIDIDLPPSMLFGPRRLGLTWTARL